MAVAPRVYRPSFFGVLSVVFVLCTLCAAFVTSALQGSGYINPGVFSWTFLRLLCIFYLWALVATLALVYTLGTRVTAQGLSGRTFWGSARDIGWYDMERVDRVGPPGCRFLRVFSAHGGSPLWVPQFLRRKKDFEAEVRLHVGAGHPLYKYVA